jgi:signal transduction histidine kinase/CheY-like chemotaxis protein
MLKGVIAAGYDLGQLRERLADIVVGRHGAARVETESGRRIEGRPTSFSGETISASHALARRPWTFVIEAPMEDFLGPLRTVKNAALATSLAGLALLVGLLLLLVRSITRPIAALVDAAHAIGQGDLRRRVDAVGADEMGALSQAFNEMAAKLESNRATHSELQTQLIQAEKLSAVGQLISSVAHELNNPLGAISGYAQILLMDSLPPQVREDLIHVRDNVKRCQKVVDNLLFFVRQSARECKRVDINAAVESSLELLRYRLQKTEDVQVVLDLVPAPPPVLGDFQQIVQVLVNLIGNACDAMDGVSRAEGKRLILRTSAHKGSAIVEIEDNGVGIRPESLAKIFNAFFTTKAPGKGTGLGLPICRQIAREHGGDVTVDSRPGRGTIFRLELPPAVEEVRAEEPEPEPVLLPPAPGRRVLVADDEKGIADLIARVLREDGDEVHVVHDGVEALNKLAAATYDLVITDIEMERAKGQDVYAALRGPDGRTTVPLAFITGDILNPKVLDFLTKSECVYLTKPFDIQELRQAARRLLWAAVRPHV